MQKIKAPSLKASHPEIKITADLEGGNELETVETIPSNAGWHKIR